MNERMRNFLVGLFVVASLTVLGVLMVWFGETPSWLPSSEWDLRITGVSDLGDILKANNRRNLVCSSDNGSVRRSTTRIGKQTSDGRPIKLSSVRG